MRLMHVMSGDSNSEGVTELKQLSRICQPLITQTFIATCKWMLTGQKDIVYIPPDHGELHMFPPFDKADHDTILVSINRIETIRK